MPGYTSMTAYLWGNGRLELNCLDVAAGVYRSVEWYASMPPIVRLAEDGYPENAEELIG